MNPGLFSKYCVRIQKPLHAPDYLTQTYVPRVQNSNEFFNINGINFHFGILLLSRCQFRFITSTLFSVTEAHQALGTEQTLITASLRCLSMFYHPKI